MHQILLPSLISYALWATSCSAVKLFIAQSDGNLTTLSLTTSSNVPNLSIVSTTAECAGNPSWLNLDSPNQILYCLDRGQANVTKGSLNSFSISSDGSLKRIARVDAPFSGVAAAYFDTVSGTRGYVTASYNKSAIAAYALGANGTLNEPLQTIYPTINKTGPIPSRQDRSYSHHVVVDPAKKFVLIPDLGGDMIRVFKYNETNIAPLEELKPLVTDPGTGPRHAVFWESENNGIFLIFNGELGQKIFSYRVEYTDTGLSFTKVFHIPALDTKLLPNTAPTSEIAITPDKRFVIVSNRQVSFPDSPLYQTGPSDTLSSFSIHENGTLSLVQLSPSGGYLPRQFSINKAGDMLAVGHQNNNTVVIWKRDGRSGKIISEADGGKLAVATVSGPVVYTMWDE